MEQGLTSYTLFLAIFPSDGNVLVTMVGPCEFVVVGCRREVYEGQTSLGMNLLVGANIVQVKYKGRGFFPDVRQKPRTHGGFMQ